MDKKAQILLSVATLIAFLMMLLLAVFRYCDFQKVEGCNFNSLGVDRGVSRRSYSAFDMVLSDNVAVSSFEVRPGNDLPVLSDVRWVF